MGTIETAVEDHMKDPHQLFTRSEYSFREGYKRGYEDGLGAKFNSWISVEDELPSAYEVGYWDGKRSGLLLFKDGDGDIYLGRVYRGIMDGRKFCEFCDKDDYEIDNVVEWKEINTY